MGVCHQKIKKTSTLKQTGCGSASSINLTTIKSHISYFDQIDLEKLDYPDLSVLLRKHIKGYRIIEEGKTWLTLTEIQNALHKKSNILIRNFNPVTDAAIELMYHFKQLMLATFKLQEICHTFDEETVERFQYFQSQLVQISLECLIAVNTLILHQEQWWSEEYFRWRRNYMCSAFHIESTSKKNVEIVGPICDFIQLLHVYAVQLGNLQNTQEVSEGDQKAQQEFLQQFYSQMKIGFFQNQSSQDSVVANEIISQQMQVSNNVKAYTLVITKN